MILSYCFLHIYSSIWYIFTAIMYIFIYLLLLYTCIIMWCDLNIVLFLCILQSENVYPFYDWTIQFLLLLWCKMLATGESRWEQDSVGRNVDLPLDHCTDRHVLLENHQGAVRTHHSMLSFFGHLLRDGGSKLQGKVLETNGVKAKDIVHRQKNDVDGKKNRVKHKRHDRMRFMEEIGARCCMDGWSSPMCLEKEEMVQ